MIRSCQPFRFGQKAICLREPQSQGARGSFNEFLPDGQIAIRERRGEFPAHEGQRFILLSLPMEDLGLKQPEAPMPFCVFGREAPERTICFFLRGADFAALQFEARVVVHRLGISLVTARGCEKSQAEKAPLYVGGRPLLWASATVTPPPFGEPNSMRSIVSLLRPYSNTTSAK